MSLHHRILYELNGGQSVASPLDLPLLGSVLTLMVVGLVMVSSASMGESGNLYGNPLFILLKQGVFVFGGLVCIAVMLMIPVKTIEDYSWLAVFLALGLLFIVLFTREINGSRRWIPLGIFNLQASEAAKLLLVVYMSGYLVRHLEQVQTQFKGFFKPLIILGISAFFLLIARDLGALVVLLAATMSMIFLAGAKWRHFGGLILLLGIFIFLAIYLEPYRMARVTAYWDPWANAYGSGYQLTQSLIAFGRGEWFGVGLGNSIQKLFYLPEAHTDFVFAVLAEEFGVFGCTLVIMLFLFVSWRIMQIGCRCEEKGLRFHAYVAYGCAVLFGSQAMMNIGVNSGLLPTKGLALPLISYGGSSLLINCLAFGLLLRIDYERRLYKVKESTPSTRRRKVGRGAVGV